MTERPAFLPPAEFVHVGPEPDGFSAALGRAQRRRRRQLGEAGVALGLAVALITGLNMPTRETGQDQVGVTDQDSPERPFTVDDDSAVDDTVIALPDGGSTGGVAPAASAPGSGGAGIRGGVRTSPTPPQKATVPGRRPAPRDPMAGGLPYKRPLSRTATTPSACVSTDWCPSLFANSVEANHYTLDFQLCRAIDAGPATVDFDSDREAEFVVSDADEDLWTWSRGQRFEFDPETITFGAGDCFVWTTDYVLTVDDYGDLLDPGTYTVRGWSFGDIVPEDVVGTTTITVE